jgi:hypothetical protein
MCFVLITLWAPVLCFFLVDLVITMIIAMVITMIIIAHSISTISYPLSISCRPYSFESTRSHLNSEVNQRKGRLVLASETGWKYLTADYFLFQNLIIYITSHHYWIFIFFPSAKFYLVKIISRGASNSNIHKSTHPVEKVFNKIKSKTLDGDN